MKRDCRHSTRFYISTMIKYVFILFIVLIVGCSGFVYEKRITKKYYLIAVDDIRFISISYKLESGAFIGRIEKVKQYSIVNDTFLIAKALDDSDKTCYYILNMAIDYDIAKVENIVIGPLDSLSFVSNWGMRYNVKFISISEL